MRTSRRSYALSLAAGSALVFACAALPAAASQVPAGPPGVAKGASSRAAAASAMGSGQDGQILYEVQDAALGDLAGYAVNPDGSHPHRLTDQPIGIECASWSPDGTQVVICGAPTPADNTTILTVDTGAIRLLPATVPNLVTPCDVWSPDGTRLACQGFNDDDPTLDGIFTVRASDGGDARRLTPVGLGNGSPGDYSPNSQQIVFGIGSDDGASWLDRVNANGTGLRRLTPPSLITGSPGSWSQAGNQIVFSARVDPDHRQSLYVMHSDGSGLHRLAIPGIPCGGPFDDPESISCADPSWSPSGLHIAFRTIWATGSALWRADADGTHAALLVDMGFDSGESIDWGTHPPATRP